MRRLSARHIVASIEIGAVLEVAVLFLLLPRDSTQPPTRLQNALAFTQAPAGSAFFLIFGTGLGHRIDKLPQPLGLTLATIGFAVVFLLQSAAMGVPVWFALQVRERCRTPRLPSE